LRAYLQSEQSLALGGYLSACPLQFCADVRPHHRCLPDAVHAAHRLRTVLNSHTDATLPPCHLMTPCTERAAARYYYKHGHWTSRYHYGITAFQKHRDSRYLRWNAFFDLSIYQDLSNENSASVGISAGHFAVIQFNITLQVNLPSREEGTVGATPQCQRRAQSPISSPLVELRLPPSGGL
jgi:hypothetical protein